MIACLSTGVLTDVPPHCERTGLRRGFWPRRKRADRGCFLKEGVKNE